MYTALRLVLFLATFGLVAGVWILLAEDPNLFLAAIVALLLSGVASYFLLDRQRSAFATRVEARGARLHASFEEHRAREDAELGADAGGDAGAPGEGDVKA